MSHSKWLLAFALVATAMGGAASAQEKPKAASSSDDRLLESMPNLTANPEIWLYLHEEKRNDDPKLAARRAAEFDIEQRKARIAARKWFGISNSRPTASPAPFMGSYSTHWSGNSYDPNQWIGVGQPTRTSAEINVYDYRR